MRDNYAEPRTGMPLKHYVIALFIAAIAGCSLWFWFSQKATESASAALEFDPTAAYGVDQGLSAAKNPAVALANSILDDQAIANLTKQSHLSSSLASSQIGEFRANLVLTQPSPNSLRVHFLGGDSGQSAANANAVAQALAAWSPSQASATPAAATAPAAAQPKPSAPPSAPAPMTGVSTPGEVHHPSSASASPNHLLSDSLGEISAQLSATDRDLDHLAAEYGTGSSTSSNPQSAYTKYRQQQLLKTRVNAVESKLKDLQPQDGKSDADVKTRLTTIQQAIGSILRGGEPDANGFRAAGTSASQLSHERAQLTHAISVVNQERQAIQQTETAHSASSGSSQAVPTPAPATPTPATAPSAHASSPQDVPPANSETSAPPLTSEHPLSLVRLANPTPPPPLWPPIVAALSCGLLYLTAASWAYRKSDSEEVYDDEEPVFPQRFITPDEPPNPHVDSLFQREEVPPSEPVKTEVPSFTPAEPEEVETTARRREPFSFFTAASKESSTPRRGPFLWDENGEASFVTHAKPRFESDESESPVKSEESADPFTDQLKKNLSQTEIGKMFEGANQDTAADSPTEKKVGHES